MIKQMLVKKSNDLLKQCIQPHGSADELKVNGTWGAKRTGAMADHRALAKK